MQSFLILHNLLGHFFIVDMMFKKLIREEAPEIIYIKEKFSQNPIGYLIAFTIGI